MDDHGCENGWVYVAEEYAQAAAAETLYDEDARPRAAIVAAFRNSIYPCKECRPDLFFRWAGGHLAPGHIAAECVECSERRSGKRLPRVPPARRGSSESSPPPPTDDDAPEPDLWQQRADLA